MHSNCCRALRSSLLRVGAALAAQRCAARGLAHLASVFQLPTPRHSRRSCHAQLAPVHGPCFSHTAQNVAAPQHHISLASPACHRPRCTAVTRGNFVLMRKAWLAGGAQTIRRLDSLTSFSSGGGGGSSGRASSSGEGKEPPNFVGHVLDCLEGDLSTFGESVLLSCTLLCSSSAPERAFGVQRSAYFCCWLGQPAWLGWGRCRHDCHCAKRARNCSSPTAVGLSAEMGICLVVVVLLMGVTGKQALCIAAGRPSAKLCFAAAGAAGQRKRPACSC